jgi:hypothetical protein
MAEVLRDQSARKDNRRSELARLRDLLHAIYTLELRRKIDLGQTRLYMGIQSVRRQTRRTIGSPIVSFRLMVPDQTAGDGGSGPQIHQPASTDLWAIRGEESELCARRGPVQAHLSLMRSPQRCQTGASSRTPLTTSRPADPIACEKACVAKETPARGSGAVSASFPAFSFLFSIARSLTCCSFVRPTHVQYLPTQQSWSWYHLCWPICLRTAALFASPPACERCHQR